MKSWIAVGSIGLAGMLVAGCATSMGARAKDEEALKSQVAALEGQISGLNQRIDEISQRQVALESQSAPAQTASRRTLSNKEIQVALKSAGHYAGPVDGKLGPQTRDAVKAFQRSQGLTPDGKVGSKTTTALAKYLNRE